MIGFGSLTLSRASRYLVLSLAILGLGLLNSCSSDSAAPDALTQGDDTGIIHGEAGSAPAFEFISATNGDPQNPIEGPFAIRGYNLAYDDSVGALLVDLTVANLGENTYPEPVTLTFLSFVPDNVTVENSDNEESGSGALIEMEFANDDAQWTPGEESLMRSTYFGIDAGTSFSFVARIDVGADDGLGSIGGIVWNDKNEDGMINDDEAGIPGVEIQLSSDGMDPMSTMTGEDGSYRFDGLEEGLYTVVKPPAEGLEPTTETQIEVILLEVDGEVLSFLAANFGCKAGDAEGPIQVGDCVHVNGIYADDPDRVVAHSIEIYRQRDYDHGDKADGDWWDDDDNGDHHDDDDNGDHDEDDRDDDDDDNGGKEKACEHEEIRGPVTDVDSENNIIEIMGTRVKVLSGKVGEFEVGDRARVRVFGLDDESDKDYAMGYKLMKWNGRPDKVHGYVQEVLDGGFRAVNTFVEITEDTNIED